MRHPSPVERIRFAGAVHRSKGADSPSSTQCHVCGFCSGSGTAFHFPVILVLVSVLLPILSIIILSHLKSQRHACLIEKKQPIQIWYIKSIAIHAHLRTVLFWLNSVWLIELRMSFLCFLPSFTSRCFPWRKKIFQAIADLAGVSAEPQSLPFTTKFFTIKFSELLRDSFGRIYFLGRKNRPEHSCDKCQNWWRSYVTAPTPNLSFWDVGHRLSLPSRKLFAQPPVAWRTPEG